MIIIIVKAFISAIEKYVKLQYVQLNFHIYGKIISYSNILCEMKTNSEEVKCKYYIP
jgi:hypothetical protein